MQSIPGLALDPALVLLPPLAGQLSRNPASRVEAEKLVKFADRAMQVSLDPNAGQVQRDLGSCGSDGNLTVGGHAHVQCCGQRALRASDGDFRPAAQRNAGFRKEEIQAFLDLGVEFATDVAPGDLGPDFNLTVSGERHREMADIVAGEAVDDDVGSLHAAVFEVFQSERIDLASDL